MRRSLYSTWAGGRPSGRFSGAQTRARSASTWASSSAASPLVRHYANADGAFAALRQLERDGKKVRRLNE